MQRKEIEPYLIKLNKMIENNSIKIDSDLNSQSIVKSLSQHGSMREAYDKITQDDKDKKNTTT